MLRVESPTACKPAGLDVACRVMQSELTTMTASFQVSYPVSRYLQFGSHMRGEPGKEARTVSQSLVESITPCRLTVEAFRSGFCLTAFSPKL